MVALVRPGRCHPLDEHRQAAREMLVDEQLASAEVVDAAQQAAGDALRRFGDYLTENQIVSPEELAAAQAQRAQPLQKLGEALVELGYLTEAELEEALAIEARDRSAAGVILADMGVVDAEIVNAVMARKLGIPYVNLKDFRIPPAVLKRIPAAAAPASTPSGRRSGQCARRRGREPDGHGEARGPALRRRDEASSGDGLRRRHPRCARARTAWRVRGVAAAPRKAADVRSISEITHRALPTSRTPTWTNSSPSRTTARSSSSSTR